MDFQCRVCGSERIAPGVRLAPEAATGSLLGRLRARVCGDCGRAEMFVDDPLDLYRAHVGGPDGGAGTGRGRADAPAAANIQCPSCGSVLPAAESQCEACGWGPTEGI